MLLRPFVHHLTELDLTIGSMMHFVDVNGKVRNGTDELAQFVGQCHTLQFFFREERRVLIAIEAVKDDLFGIGDSHQSLQIFKRLMIVDFLGIGILDAVALIGRFLFIQNLKLNQSAQFCSRWFRDNPRWVELLDMLQTGND